jgi:hypothetical protein
MLCRWVIANDFAADLSLSASGFEIGLPLAHPRNRRFTLRWLLPITPWSYRRRKSVF